MSLQLISLFSIYDFQIICHYPVLQQKLLKYLPRVVVRGSSVGIATGWTVVGSNLVGGVIFRTRPDRIWGPPIFLHNRHSDSCPGIKRPGRGVDHPPPSIAEVEERIEYTSSGPLWPVLG